MPYRRQLLQRHHTQNSQKSRDASHGDVQDTSSSVMAPPRSATTKSRTSPSQALKVNFRQLQTKHENKMILEYGIKNFLSFREGATVSFRLDGNAPSHITDGRDYATILCVKGANGSGKTHLLKGLAFIANFAAKSFSTDPEAEIAVDTHFQSNEPAEFYVEFIAEDEITYIYELAVTKKSVLREALYQKKQRRTKLFERNGRTVSAIKRLAEIETINYRDNASVISTLQQHKNKEFESVYSLFYNTIFNVSQAGFREQRGFDLANVSQFCHEHPSALEFIAAFIIDCDVGISKITISSDEDENGKKRYFPIFHHIIGEHEFPVHLPTESNGTKYLFRMLLAHMLAISSGSMFIADEFDIYLHPDILPKIIDLYTNKETNDRGAQLLFSAHNSDILDICGKYRSILVNKENNASYAYRLDELPGDMLRNDRSISTPYKEGKLGGVPRL